MTDWDRAACLDADPDAFVPDAGQSAWTAKTVCRTACPIMGECRAFGLAASPFTHMGVYGGLSQQERRDVRAGRLTEADVDARDAEVIAAGGWHAHTGQLGGEAKRRQAELRHRQAECGTDSGYKAHRRLGEDACGTCARAHRAYERELRRRQKGVAA